MKILLTTAARGRGQRQQSSGWLLVFESPTVSKKGGGETGGRLLVFESPTVSKKGGGQTGGRLFNHAWLHSLHVLQWPAGVPSASVLQVCTSVCKSVLRVRLGGVPWGGVLGVRFKCAPQVCPESLQRAPLTRPGPRSTALFGHPSRTLGRVAHHEPPAGKGCTP
eukprot:360559-Chlamydomonas_euryale.AAC.1